MAVPNGIAALGGSGMVCGQSLCRQRLNRRHSALVRLSPANKPRDRSIVPSACALAGALIPGNIRPIAVHKALDEWLFRVGVRPVTN